MQVKTAREYDEAGKVHIREAVCPWCGKINWFVEELDEPYLKEFCPHYQGGYSVFIFTKR